MKCVLTLAILSSLVAIAQGECDYMKCVQALSSIDRYDLTNACPVFQSAINCLENATVTCKLENARVKAQLGRAKFSYVTYCSDYIENIEGVDDSLAETDEAGFNMTNTVQKLLHYLKST